MSTQKDIFKLIKQQSHEILSNLERLQQEIKAEEFKLRSLVDNLSIDMPNLQDAINFLYWEIHKVSLELIVQRLGLTSKEVKKYILPFKTNIICNICEKPFLAKSRSDLAGLKSLYKKSSNRICSQCREMQIKLLKEDYKESLLRLKELKKMPYKEYLLSPEWNETRKSHLKRAKYQCQVCNKGDTILHVHHRTYENLGEEKYNDLLALCGDCHELFHKNGKLSASQ